MTNVTTKSGKLQNVMAVTDGLGRFWQFINRSQEEVAMKKILIFSVVRFAAFAVPIAVMCFVH